MSTYVPGYGSSSAKLIVVGEAPGKVEEELRLPFVGPSGELLNGVLRAAGTSRDEVYLTNVVKIRPPDNDLKRLHELGRKIEEFLPQLWDEIAAINPNCILALGGTALKYLTGFTGIEKYRGSILQNCHTGLPKVVSSLHPASLLHKTESSGMRSWKELAYIRADATRAVEQSQFRELKLPVRTLLVASNSLDLIRFLDRHSGEDKVTLDVETSRTIPLCIAFAFNRYEAMSVPLLEVANGNEGIPLHDLAYIWRVIAEFLQDTRIKVIGQNLKFDEKRCRQVGLRLHDVWFDTMLGWHTLYPEFPKRLQFISSILTEEPYYKDEGSEYNPKKDKLSRLLLYNAKDAAVEFECFEKIQDELVELNLLGWFFERMMPLHRLYSDLEDVGILIDEEARKQLGEKYRGMRDKKHEELVSLVGHEINPASWQQVANLLYGELRCPPRKDTGEDTLKALINNVVKDERRKRIITLVLEERKVRKTIGTYIEARPSEDNRMRTQCRIAGTESGRTSTAILEPPVSVMQEGMALQTLTKYEDVTLEAGGADLRSMFIADPGYIFIEADLSQAEDRVVAVLAKDWDAFDILDKKEFKRNQHGMKDDRHTLTAVLVCGMGFDSITDYYRQIGKKTRHAGNYDMGKHTHMLQLAKFGIFISEWRAGKNLEKFHDANPKIRQVFHAGIQQALQDNDCVLYSPHGRRRTFYNRWGDELFKEAYSYIPQATVTDHLKFAMLRIRKRLPKGFFEFVQESHDSFLALCWVGHSNSGTAVELGILPTAVATIREELETPISFRKCTLSRDYNLIIPCDIKVGTRWSDLKELKCA